ncbi:MAG: hypothetical protein PHV36_04285 [Elusimicrobiales bacterium]|nr:hypothetical protein [Elusimicrobiales bacterium]
MNKTAKILLTAAASFAAGNLSAADFGKDIQNIGSLLKGEKFGSAEIAAPLPPPAGAAAPAGSDRWWSVSFFGSAHKAVMKGALSFMNGKELSDIARAQDMLLTGTNDESAHLPDAKINNGGKPEELWEGKAPYTLGGVLWNYEHFKFPEAYAKMGTICHLTQDQATPTHAANIRHSTNDGFEGYAADGNKVKITASRDEGQMKPYEYYQDLQDETRKHLSSWVNPRTGKPYWVPAKNSPPPGQDATFGPWGSYGPDGDSYTHTDQTNSDGGNNNTQVTDSPEIRVRQLSMAGAATVGVLKSASKRLPPLVSGLTVTPAGRKAAVKFTVLDNRSRYAVYSITIYQDGKERGAPQAGKVDLADPASPELMLKGEVNTTLDLSDLAPGGFTLQVRVTDTDGNTIPEEVNADDIPANDTRAALTMN